MSIFMDNVACAGTESRLVDCPFDRHTADCIYSEDAGVRCQEGTFCKSTLVPRPIPALQVWAWG